jgi:hypothetical protein
LNDSDGTISEISEPESERAPSAASSSKPPRIRDFAYSEDSLHDWAVSHAAAVASAEVRGALHVKSAKRNAHALHLALLAAAEQEKELEELERYALQLGGYAAKVVESGDEARNTHVLHFSVGEAVERWGAAAVEQDVLKHNVHEARVALQRDTDALEQNSLLPLKQLEWEQREFAARHPYAMDLLAREAAEQMGAKTHDRDALPSLEEAAAM